jgi:HSP20 family protein
MALMRRREIFPSWDPVQELEEMSNRIDRLFGQMRRGDGEETLSTARWAPRVNVAENENEYLITAELPAVNKDDVHVRMDDGNLTIEGERKQREEKEGERYHRIESSYGHFFRRFHMPENADANKIDAKFENGMLEIHIGKSERTKGQAQEIPIK